MTFSPTDSRIYSVLFSDSDVAEIFSDEQFIAYCLAVEVALAKVQSRLEIIPAEAGPAVAAAAADLTVDFEQMQIGTEKAGLPIIDLVNQLRAQVAAESDGIELASYVHWGATTQDIMDTALVLQIREALASLEEKLTSVIKKLATLAERHRHTLMAGRTHAQQALPIPFGLKVANWLAPLLRHRQRLVELKPRSLTVQFGGAAGTLASLGEQGPAVQAGLAAELALAVSPLPWHTQRDNLAELAAWLSLVSGSLAKMGQDIILLAQTEVGEVRESSDLARGGSSTMPQKSNPVVSELIIAAARTNASLLSSMHHALIQEHERATHGWQLEWLNLSQMFSLTAAALNKALFLSENLVIYPDKMKQNVQASNGLMLAEAISFALSAYMERPAAKKLVTACCHLVMEQNRHLADIVREHVDFPLDWESLKDEAAYFGASQQFIDQILREVDP